MALEDAFAQGSEEILVMKARQVLVLSNLSDLVANDLVGCEIHIRRRHLLFTVEDSYPDGASFNSPVKQPSYQYDGMTTTWPVTDSRNANQIGAIEALEHAYDVIIKGYFHEGEDIAEGWFSG
jgi:hypothetical protein